MLGQQGRLGVEVDMNHPRGLGSTLILKGRSPSERIHHESSSLSCIRGTAGKESTSRGVRLLLKAKEFHSVAWGRAETSGFNFIESQSRRSKQQDRAPFVGRRRRPHHHRWDSPSERVPSDFYCFWKLTPTGAAFTVTTPDALFSSQARSKHENSSRPNLMSSPRHCDSPGLGDIPLVPHTSSSFPASSSSAEAAERQQPPRQQGWVVPRQKMQTVSGNPCLQGDRSVTPNLQDGESILVPKSATTTTPMEYPWAKSRGPSHVDGTTAIICRDRIATAPGGASLVVLSWGGGGQFRLGTGRERQELSPICLPQEMMKGRQVVDIAAGKRHTLFLCDDGLMFSVGEGLRWQLGTTSEYLYQARPRGVQRLPKQVHPTGELKTGRDLQVAQAAAGDAFCIAREANGEDAARATEGFIWMKESVHTLLEQWPGSTSVTELWDHIVEEERTMGRRFEGRLVSWGSGSCGELGLGPEILHRRTPHLTHLRVAVRSVVAGAAHALCVTLDGEVYSWGRGRDGRLGQGDYQDRWEACRVEALRGTPIRLISAGRAHSMAVSYPRIVYVWGRGQHGRLGTGDLRSRNSPVRLKSWPPGFLGCAVRDIALGGAHSILLAHRSVPVTRANPWGTESLAYAWGYGYCGQLGVGERVEEIMTPSKIAFDRKELITQVAAGKAYSLACNAQGHLFSWGKGWAGEIAVGKDREYRVAPTKIDFPGAGRHLILKLAAGERHVSSVALACSSPARGWEQETQWRKVKDSYVGIKRWESPLLRLWRCPRRPPWRQEGPNPEALFSCMTCDLTCVCRTCSRLCHQGHEVSPCSRTLRVLCECGLSSCGPRSGDEGTRPRKGARVRCRLLASVEDEDGGCDRHLTQQSASVCQRVIRGWLRRRAARRKMEERRRRRREAVEAFWYTDVHGAIGRSIARFFKEQERERNRDGMLAADKEAAFYRYYRQLQPAILSLNRQRDALRDISIRKAAGSNMERAHQPVRIPPLLRRIRR